MNKFAKIMSEVTIFATILGLLLTVYTGLACIESSMSIVYFIVSTIFTGLNIALYQFFIRYEIYTR